MESSPTVSKLHFFPFYICFRIKKKINSAADLETGIICSFIKVIIILSIAQYWITMNTPFQN